ncbi:MAG: methyltransferase domain-containing protein [Alphaproteobacteria bacterium]|nr:methyltransferase domain-containing protein [Alphaproteobacteria bacterium]
MDYTEDYLLNKTVKIYQPINGYRAAIDAVFLASMVAVDKIKSGAKIADIGSGTGAVSLCLAARLKAQKIEITGFEIQSNLVDLSNQSATANGFDFLRYELCDIREKNNDKAGIFDVVVTNPPYSDHDMPSPNESKKYAHNMQNFDLNKWLSACLKMLKPKGYFAIINRTEALNEILLALHNKAGNIQILPLYSKEGQQAKRILIVAEKGSHAPTKILPPLYTHDNEGNYSKEAEKILRQAQGYFDL